MAAWQGPPQKANKTWGWKPQGCSLPGHIIRIVYRCYRYIDTIDTLDVQSIMYVQCIYLYTDACMLRYIYICISYGRFTDKTLLKNREDISTIIASLLMRAMIFVTHIGMGQMLRPGATDVSHSFLQHHPFLGYPSLIHAHMTIGHIFCLPQRPCHMPRLTIHETSRLKFGT